VHVLDGGKASLISCEVSNTREAPRLLITDTGSFVDAAECTLTGEWLLLRVLPLCGLEASGAVRVVMMQSAVERSHAGDGIKLPQGATLLAGECLVSGNALVGMQASDCSQCVLEGCTIADNTLHGALARTGSSVHFFECTVCGNAEGQIVVRAGAHTSLERYSADEQPRSIIAQGLSTEVFLLECQVEGAQALYGHCQADCAGDCCGALPGRLAAAADAANVGFCGWQTVRNYIISQAGKGGLRARLANAFNIESL